MTVSADHIVAEARTWLGTPYLHQGRERGRFTDCIGLVIGVARALELGDYRRRDYQRVPDPRKMSRELRRHLDPVSFEQAGPGCILWFAIAGQPRHVGILAEHPQGGLSVIHAWAEVGRVVEHRLDARWRRRVCGAFRYRQPDEEKEKS